MHPGGYASEPGKLAVVMADGRQLTYAELEDQSNRLAHWFRQVGLRRGDHIAFVIENRPEFFVVIWAAQRAGLYYTPCSTRLNDSELAHIVSDSRARVLIATVSTVDVADRAAAPCVEHRLLVDTAVSRPGWRNLARELSELPGAPITDQSEGVYMLYSSGTTGVPKGVKRSLPTQPFPLPASAMAGLFGISQSTVFLSPAPLYHAAPLAFAFLVHRSGGCIVVQEHFDPEQFLALIETHRVTTSQVVPTMFIRLLRLPTGVRARYDLSSLRAVIHSAAPCPVEVKERMIDWLGPIIHEYYSSTEAIGFVYCDSDSWLAHRGTVGRSLWGPIHIVGEDGSECPTGREGTVYFEKSDFEYHGDADKTAEARDVLGRGWSTVGDIGYVDDDGFLYLSDRRAYMIISGGVNVYPQEAENVLVVHPMVADVAVFGVPDDDLGERVHAVVQLADGVAPSGELETELVSYCRERLAHFKCPRSIDFREVLPREETGKLYKRLLRAEYWGGRTLTG